MTSLNEFATDALRETGAIVQCAVHDDVWMDNLDVGANEEAKNNLLNLVADGSISASETDVDRAIAHVLAEHPDECGSCTSNMMS